MNDDYVTPFLLNLLGGHEYTEATATRSIIRQPRILQSLFTDYICVIPESQQIALLDAIISLIRSNCGNVEACASIGLQQIILQFLSDRGLFPDPCLTIPVLKKTLRVFLYLANHSVDNSDIRSMLAVFQSPRMVHEQPDDTAMSYYIATLEMIARDSFGPSSFFDLTGEYSGLTLPKLEAFPSNGYTFCCWLKLEYLPKTSLPIFQFLGGKGLDVIGIEASLQANVLKIKSIDTKKNHPEVIITDFITEGRWHFMTIVHSHRQIRGSKVEVFLNADSRFIGKLSYPNIMQMGAVTQAHLASSETKSLRVLLGPTALFGQALPSNIISNIRSPDEYDALVFQFNSYLSSSSSSSMPSNSANESSNSNILTNSSGSTSSNEASGNSTTNSTDGLIFAYDARNCDRLKGICFDASGNDYHAKAASAGVRLRHAGTFKQAIAQLGGPLLCLPLLVPLRTNSTLATLHNEYEKPAQFQEDYDFLSQMHDVLARPLGVKCIPKVLLLIGEIMRFSLVNKFIFRRHHGIRLTALLIRSLPEEYLTQDLFTAMERLRSAVMSDRTLSDEIYKFLLFNFRIWVNAPVELQATVFDKLELQTRKDVNNSSAVSTRHFLRCLSWIYWKTPSDISFRRTKEYKNDEIEYLRKRVLGILKIVLAESQPVKSKLLRRSSTNEERNDTASTDISKTHQLSYECTRSLIFCMIGRPTNPMSTGLSSDGTSSLPFSTETQDGTRNSNKSQGNTISDGEAEAGSVVENVPESDLPDLLQLLIELSVEPSAPAGLLGLFGKLGGLRIWLPLLDFEDSSIVIMTLRLLRTYLYLKCGCCSDLKRIGNSDKTQLSIGDAFLILKTFEEHSHRVTMGVYSELLLILLGVQVTEKDMKALDGKSQSFELLIDESLLTSATIWHSNLLFPFLNVISCSALPIRIIAIRHLSILFLGSTPTSIMNRNVLLQNCVNNCGPSSTPSSTDQIPLIEAIFSFRGNADTEPSVARVNEIFGISLHNSEESTAPMSKLRDLVLYETSNDGSANIHDENYDNTRVKALYSIILMDDMDFISELVSLKGSHRSVYEKFSNLSKLATIELISQLKPHWSVQLITDNSHELISSIVSLESKTNELSWAILQDPFTILSRVIKSKEELEVVVVTLLEQSLNKLSATLSAELSSKDSSEPSLTSRQSTLWRNAESIATLCAAIALHYDPDTLGNVDPSTLTISRSRSSSAGAVTAIDETANAPTAQPVEGAKVFFKCERVLWHEVELVDAILNVWQHFTGYLHPGTDASFGRRNSVPSRYTSSTSSSNGRENPDSTSMPALKRGSSAKLPFGMGLSMSGLANSLSSTANSTSSTNNAQSSTVPDVVVTSRPHPGGPMREVLQLVLRCLYLALFDSEKHLGNENNNLIQDDLLLDLGNSENVLSAEHSHVSQIDVFGARIRKLEYFINAIGIGARHGMSDSSFTLSRNSIATSLTPGLVTSSSLVKATQGDETSLLLWFIPELAQLITIIRKKQWSDPAVKLASILASLVQIPLRSSQELATLLAQSDFMLNNTEVCRRDCFYHEQLTHAREGRETKRAAIMSTETREKGTAAAELARIRKSTRITPSSSVANNGDDSGESDRLINPQVWLERVRAKDIDDWMKLRIFLRWGVRHIWSSQNILKLETDLNDNEFWILDPYTSSNWIRSRLLPDAEVRTQKAFVNLDTNSNLDSNTHSHVVDDTEMDASFALPSVGAIKAHHSIESEEFDMLINDDDEEEEGDVENSNDAEQGNVLVDVDSFESISESVAVEEATQQQNTQSEVDAKTDNAPAPTYVSLGRRGSVSSSPDVAGSFKSATDKNSSRIGTLSTRFSSGIMRLAGARSSSNRTNTEEDTTHDETTNESKPETETDSSRGSLSGDASRRIRTASSLEDTDQSLAGRTSTSKSPTSSQSPQHKIGQWKNLSACYRTKAYLILPSGIMVYGILRIGSTTIVFEGEYVTSLHKLSHLTNTSSIERVNKLSPRSLAKGMEQRDNNVTQLKRRVWGVRVIRVIYRRRFLMDPEKGVEIYFVDGTSCFFGLEQTNEADLIYATLKERKPPCLAKWGKRLLSADRMFSKSQATEAWVRREMSTFEYIMFLNVAAGRSYSDLSQYPIFPWILQDYSSPVLHLDDPSVYRDLSKPIYVQTASALQRIQECYARAQNSNSQVPPYHTATVCSTTMSVLYFLCRLAPFSRAADLISNVRGITPQSFMFSSVEDAFQKCCNVDGHGFEVTPEFYYLPDFLFSNHNQDLSIMDKTRNTLTNVTLPPWANSPHDFVRQHRLALESDYVSENLHLWIDLIFGCRRNGAGAIDSSNIHHIACYPERLDLTALNVGVRSKLTSRGTVPLQLFSKAHPKRMSQDEALEQRFPTSHAMAQMTSRRQIRRYDLPSRHKSKISSICFTNVDTLKLQLLSVGVVVANASSNSQGSASALSSDAKKQKQQGIVVYVGDDDGMVYAKRYLNTLPDQGKLCPVSLVEVDKWWKLPSGSLVHEGVVYYEQMISCGYWDGSWRIHWSADGELLQRIAFHKKRILCMARSEDEFTGDLALAFGSEDCTVSIWALSKFAATKSRRMFVKKEPPVGGLPWVLLFGHVAPVVAVTLNVDLDVVASASREHTVLIHSLRSATPLHRVEIQPITKDLTETNEFSRSIIGNALASNSPDVPNDNTTVSHLVISKQGDVLVHAITSPLNKPPQSWLFLVSMNGHVESKTALVTSEGIPQVLLPKGVFFTRSGQYIITATAISGIENLIEVRDAGMPSSVMRKIDCKRTNASLTCIQMSPDERCILCGYDDGSIVAYAFHFGISDGCASMVGLEKKAREQEAEAFARANKLEMLKKVGDIYQIDQGASKFMFKRPGNSHKVNGENENGNAIDDYNNVHNLWIKSSKMPSEPYLSIMQEHFQISQHRCTSDEPAYEALLRKLWCFVYQVNNSSSLDLSESEAPKPRSPMLLIDLSSPTPDIVTQSNNDTQHNKREYERVGESWSRLGFQRPDPTTDFRSGGRLSLQCLVFFVQHHHAHAERMIAKQIPGSHENTYPWGPAGINVGCMLARLFWKADGMLLKEQAANWTIFETLNSFYEVFSEVFLLFDHLWTEMNANYGAFSMVIEATKTKVLEALDESRGDRERLLRRIRAHVSPSTSQQSPRTYVGKRPASSSVEDFLMTLSNGISSVLPNSPPLRSARTRLSGSREDRSMMDDLFSINLEDAASGRTRSRSGPAPSNSISDDPFAGNDVSQWNLQHQSTTTNPDISVDVDDPFAFLQ